MPGFRRHILTTAALAAVTLSIAACSGDTLQDSARGIGPCGQDWADSSKHSPSHAFWRYNADRETVDSCLRRKPRLAKVKDEYGAASLHMAARNSTDPAVLETLIRHGAEVNATTNRGNTPLHWAAGVRESSRYDPEFLEVLLRNGAEVDARDGDGNTALHLAVFNKTPEIIEVLIRHGAEVDARNNDGDTPLLLAARRGNSHGVMALLIRHGADTGTTGSDGNTALKLATTRSDSKGWEFQNAVAQRGEAAVVDAEGFQKGLRAVDAEDYEAAMEAFLPLAERGDPRVQFALGHMYENALGVGRSVTDAASWYRRAAKRGHAEAQNNLGAMYASGNGVPRNHQAAHIWLSIAVENGFDGAGAALRQAESRLSPAQVEEARDLARECVESRYRNCP